MPLYDFSCLNCDYEDERHVPYDMRNEEKCPKCAAKLAPVGGPSTVTFQRGWYEHIAPNPIFCDNARELKEACDKNDARSPYLEDSPWRRGL